MENNSTLNKQGKIPYDTARNCRHYAMCKIDFLGSGVCASGLEKHFVSFYPQGRMILYEALNGKFRLIAEKYQIDNDFGFITPIDNGKRCIFEYDYFFDHTDPDEIRRIRLAGNEANILIDEYSVKTGTVKGHPYVLYQGFCRKENLLYS